MFYIEPKFALFIKYKKHFMGSTHVNIKLFSHLACQQVKTLVFEFID